MRDDVVTHPALDCRTVLDVTTYLHSPARLQALQLTGLLDAPTDATLHRLTGLASRLLGAPIALATLVEPHRQFLAASAGLDRLGVHVRETPLSMSFCRLVVESRAPLEVCDATRDERVCDHEAIASLGVRAYLGVPLRSGDGEVLGSFCVVDRTPRTWTEDDLATLVDLASIATSAIEASRVAEAFAGNATFLAAGARAERGLRLLLEVTTAMASTTDTEGAMRAALHAMCNELEWEYGESWLPPQRRWWESPGSSADTLLSPGPAWFAPEDARLAAFHEESRRIRFASGQGLPGTVLRDRRAVFDEELSTSSRVSRIEPVEAAGLRTAYAVPVIADGEVAAVFTFFTRRPTQVTDAHVTLIAAVADGLGAALRRTLVESRLADERAFLGAVLDSLSENVSVCAPDGRMVLCNRATLETFAIPAGQPLAVDWFSAHARVLAPDGRTPLPREELPHARVLSSQADAPEVEFVVAVEGREARRLVANAHVLRAADGTFAGSVCAARDMTAQKRAESALRESELAFRGMLENLRTLAHIVDERGRVKFVNDATLELTGWTRDVVVGTDWFARFAADPTPQRRLFARTMAGEETIPHFESEILTRTGRRRLVVWDTTVLRDPAGRIVGAASIGQDVTEQRTMQERLASLSEHDELTGLLNRRGFVARMEYAIRAGARGARRDALLYIDLDHFKPINDNHGHAAGDAALCAVAALLRGAVRETDVVGRLGGDEFAVYAVDVESPDGVTALLERMQVALVAHNADARERGVPWQIAFSVGTAMLQPGDTREGLLARADAMLYERKHQR